MIITVTLNASIDKAYSMDDKLINGTVMRVSDCCTTAGGKGINVARVAMLCGEKSHAIGICGGFNGQLFRSLLHVDGVSESFTVVDKETRNCINVIDKEYGSTEFLEPGALVSADDVAMFLKHFEEVLPSSDVIVLSGSAPQGCPTDIYARMIASAKALGKAVILDTSKELLVEGIKALPTMIKPNKDEIEYLLGKKPDGLQETIVCAKELNRRGIPIVVVSLGEQGAILACDEGVYHGIPPAIEVVNAVGCGDSMVAAFAVALMRKMSASQALQYAVSIATCNAMTMETGSFDPKMSEDVLSRTVVKRI